MRGPYLLRPLQVDILVPATIGGIYCLGEKKNKVAVVARSDRNLRDAIKAHWNEYEFFWYEPALSLREAYISECYAFHRYAASGTLERTEHPKPPDKIDIKCPVCGV